MISKDKPLFAVVLLIFTLMIFAVPNVNAVPPRANLLPSDYATGMTYDQAVKMKKPMAINFYVDWCHYCKHFAPILDSFRQKYKSKMNFVIVNVETPLGKKLIKEFPINGYPSLYLYNPNTGNRNFINQAIYNDKKRLNDEFVRFIKFNK